MGGRTECLYWFRVCVFVHEEEASTAHIMAVQLVVEVVVVGQLFEIINE